MAAPSAKALYEFTEAGFFLGQHYKAGDRKRFHSRQVEHNLHRMRLVDETPAKPEKVRK